MTATIIDLAAARRARCIDHGCSCPACTAAREKSSTEDQDWLDMFAGPLPVKKPRRKSSKAQDN
jgi:hypothetical protein